MHSPFFSFEMKAAKLMHFLLLLQAWRRAYELRSLYIFPSYANGANKRYKWQHCRPCFQSAEPARRKGSSHHAYFGGVGKVWDGCRPMSHIWWWFKPEHYGHMQSSGWIMYVWQSWQRDSGHSLTFPCLLSTACNWSADREKSQWDDRKYPWPRHHVCQSRWFPSLCWLHSSVPLLLQLRVN